MKNRALTVALIAATCGLLAFIFIQVSSTSGVGVGVKKAQADCTEESPECLPHLDMIDTEGTAWTADALAGKVVVINFWATWCAPCQAEVPDLAKVYDDHAGDGLVLLGLMTDSASEAALASFASRTGLDYPVVRVDDDLAFAFGYPSALPTTFIYDRSGHLVSEHLGSITAAQLERELEGLL